jgi:hypothetical protein
VNRLQSAAKFPLTTPAEQGSLLAQVGLLDPAKLPVTGSEQARKLGCGLANYATATLLASPKGLGCSLDIVAWLTP